MRRGAKLPLIAALLLVALLASCAGAEDRGSRDDAPRLATESSSPPRSEGLAGLSLAQAAVQRLLSLRSFHATVVLDTKGGDHVEGEFDFVGPDRYHLKIGGGVPLEVIGIGAETYVKAGGRWQRAEPTFLPFSPQQLLAGLSTSAGAGEPRVAGTEIVDGAACQIYEIGPPEAASAYSVDPSGLVRRFSYADGPTTVTVSFSSFDAVKNITAP